VETNFGDADGRAVIEICRRLDGIPLAIELAAARVLALSPTEIAAHLDERFRLLTGGRRAALERHHTLRAAVDWSYSLLADAERDLFDCLGVFPGTFDVGGAQAVAGELGIEAWDVVDALANLVAKSMLVADRSAEGSTRYQMLETLRHYARERLDAADRADTCRRAHARQYLAVATDIVVDRRAGNEAAAGRRIAQELDNFRAAVAWGLDSTDPADGELAMGIIATLMGSAAAGSTGLYTYAEQAAERAASCGVRYRSLLLTAASYNAYMRGEFALGQRLAANAVRDCVAGALGPGTVLAMGLVFASAGELPSLVDRGVQTLQAADAELYDHAALHAAAAAMAVEVGDLPFAQAEASIAVELGRRGHSPLQTGLALYAFALASWQTDADAARAALEEALRIAYQTGGTMAGARDRALALAAQLRASAGDLAGGLEALGEALRVAHADGDRTGMASSLARGVGVMLLAGDAEAAAVFAGAVGRCHRQVARAARPRAAHPSGTPQRRPEGAGMPPTTAPPGEEPPWPTTSSRRSPSLGLTPPRRATRVPLKKRSPPRDASHALLRQAARTRVLITRVLMKPSADYHAHGNGGTWMVSRNIMRSEIAESRYLEQGRR
jgi:hypothetical protein